MNFDEKKLRELDDSARSNRNLKLYEDAIEDLDAAIEIIQLVLESGEERDASKKEQFSKKLADYLGMKGGIYRRMGKIDEALEVYSKGLSIEELLGTDSYNRSNVIALSIVKEPSSLPKWLPKIRGSIDLISGQAERRGQWWVHADLGMLYLLSGQFEKAMENYEEFKNTGARFEDYQTTIDVLVLLRNSLQAGGCPVAAQISEAIACLAQHQRNL